MTRPFDDATRRNIAEFCAAFARVSDAVAAAASAHRALASEDFSAVGGLKVRCALHTGEAAERDGDYFGPGLNRVARLMAIGHGGQTLISGVARDLVRERLPPGVTFTDLGSHRLQDLTEPEHVWQLNVAGQQNEFPELRSLDTLANNLPIQRTTFVGREGEVAKVKELLDRHRVLTLVGSGGVGKTRLAIQAGADQLDRYPDGVWFVDFAPIGDPELVASVVAQALGIGQRQDQRVDETIPQWLKRKTLLLIFDNCEHVVEPAAALADAILATAQNVRILATSRQALDIGGEAVHRLPSLAVPAEGAASNAADAVGYGAVRLFVDRAKAADSRFVLTDESAPIVAEICGRLDGIALAIELAAARVKVLSIPNLATRLSERFRLLTGGSRSALPRQKTLAALIDWSYDLLTPQEQLLFARLGIFAGGFSLDAATSVCGGEGLDEIEILDLLTSLTDKSLIVADTSGAKERFRLLESTAAYALAKLETSDDRERMVRRHAEYFREQAEAADQRSSSGSTAAWLAGVNPEVDNYRAALEWALTQEHDAVLGGAIAGALERLWSFGGLVVEGRYWSELALARVSDAEHPAIAGRLELTLSGTTDGKGKHDAAQRALHLYESVGDLRHAARAQWVRGFALYQMGQVDEAREATAQALAAIRAFGSRRDVAHCRSQLAYIEAHRRDFNAARRLFAEALEDEETLGDDLTRAGVLSDIGEAAFAAGDPKEALRFANEALDLASRAKHLAFEAAMYGNATAYRIALNDLSGARESAREGLHVAQQAQARLQGTICLQHLALIAALGDDARRGAQLLGYVDAQYDGRGIRREPTEQWGYDKLLAAMREKLSADEIGSLGTQGAAWAEGRAVEEALSV